MMGTTIKELVRRGHDLASELKADCGAVDVRDLAQLISELASALDVQTARSEALAAENANFREVLTAIRDDWFIHDGGIHVWQVGGETLEQCMTRELSEAPAIDAFLAEVRAQGVEILTSRLQQLIDEGNFEGDEIGIIAGAVYTGADIAKQLRGNSNGGAL